MWPIRAQPGDLVKMVQHNAHTHTHTHTHICAAATATDLNPPCAREAASPMPCPIQGATEFLRQTPKIFLWGGGGGTSGRPSARGSLPSPS